MNKLKKLIEYILHNPQALILAILVRLAPIIPDRQYLKWMFRLKMGYKLNLDNPQTFSEKLQWLKLYNRKPEYTQMVDKYEAKKYVASIIGEEYIIPTLGVWNKFEDIDFDKLPNQFVLKTTHGGGNTGVVICKDKSSFDKAKAKQKLEKSLKSDVYKSLKEWPYKNVKKRIIAEVLIGDGQIEDYKFSCYNGGATDVMICMDRGSGDTKFYFFDCNWELLRYNKRGLAAPKEFSLPRPQNLDKMFEIASALSKNIPYLRVDLYNINGRIYFGETTFFPQSGFDPNLLPPTEVLFGSRIKL